MLLYYNAQLVTQCLLHTRTIFLAGLCHQEAYVDSAALAESQLELEEERAAQGLSNEPAPSFEVDEVDDWEVRGSGVVIFV